TARCLFQIMQERLVIARGKRSNFGDSGPTSVRHREAEEEWGRPGGAGGEARGRRGLGTVTAQSLLGRLMMLCLKRRCGRRHTSFHSTVGVAVGLAASMCYPGK